MPVSFTAGVVEYIADDDLTNLAPLTIERETANGARRLGSPIGGRVLRVGGRAFIRAEPNGSGIRIEGDFDPAAMNAQAGGASFLLERGVGQTVTTGVLEAWADRYGLNNFTRVSGSPGVGLAGQMSVVAGLDADTTLTRAVTFTGNHTLIGFSGRISAIVGTDASFFEAQTTGRGFRIAATASNSAIAIQIKRDSAVQSVIDINFTIGKLFAFGIAINRATGYAYVFADKSLGNRETEKSFTGGFVLGWGSLTASLGPILSSSQSMSLEVYAVTIRDNLSFASTNDARDQAAAMCFEMRKYYA